MKQRATSRRQREETAATKEYLRKRVSLATVVTIEKLIIQFSVIIQVCHLYTIIMFSNIANKFLLYIIYIYIYLYRNLTFHEIRRDNVEVEK